MNPYYADQGHPPVTLYLGQALDVLARIPTGSVACCVTSPPYFGLRDYNCAPVDWPAVDLVPMKGLPPVAVPAMSCQLGLEPDPWAYTAHLTLIFREVRRVLAKDGTLWLNLGDSYAGKANGGSAYDRHRGSGHRSKEGIIPRRINNTDAAPYKSLMGMPWRVALALVDTGWVLRNDVIWRKTNAMPESVTDRFSSSKEYLFVFSKSARYWFNVDPVRVPHTKATLDRYAYEFQPAGATHAARVNGNAQLLDGGKVEPNPLGRNPGDVWDIPTAPFPHAHFAVMPLKLASQCVQAGCRPGGAVLDPFNGAGTTGLAAALHDHPYIGVDLSAEYLDLALRTRLAQRVLT